MGFGWSLLSTPAWLFYPVCGIHHSWFFRVEPDQADGSYASKEQRSCQTKSGFLAAFRCGKGAQVPLWRQVPQWRRLLGGRKGLASEEPRIRVVGRRSDVDHLDSGTPEEQSEAVAVFEKM